MPGSSVRAEKAGFTVYGGEEFPLCMAQEAPQRRFLIEFFDLLLESAGWSWDAGLPELALGEGFFR